MHTRKYIFKCGNIFKWLNKIPDFLTEEVTVILTINCLSPHPIFAQTTNHSLSFRSNLLTEYDKTNCCLSGSCIFYMLRLFSDAINISKTKTESGHSLFNIYIRLTIQSPICSLCNQKSISTYYMNTYFSVS